MRVVLKATLFFMIVVGPILTRPLYSLKDLNPEDYLPTQWTIEKGLPQNTVKALCRTPDGYLWLGTRSGIVRFDGIRFHVLNRWNSPLLPSEEVLSLFPEPSGGLWVGTSAGLVFLGERGWEALSHEETGSGNFPITALTTDQFGNLWVGTPGGLFQVKKGTRSMRKFQSRGHPDSVFSLVRNHRGEIFLGTGNGRIFRFTADRPEAIQRVSGVPGRIHSMAADGAGGLWVAASSGLFQLNLPGKEPEWIRLEIDAVPVTLLPADESTLWVGTRQQGLLRVSRDRTQPVQFSLFGERSVLSIMMDREGNLWVGTDVSGLFRLRKRSILPLGTTVGPVAAVIEGEPGEIWMTRRQGGIVRFRDGGRLFPENGGDVEPALNSAISLWKQSAGGIWAGTRGQGILRLQADREQERSFLTGLRVSIHAVIEDSGGETWVATDGGVFRGKPGAFQPVAMFSGKNVAVSSLLKGPNGVLWAGGDQGVWQHREGVWKRLSSKAEGEGPREVTTLFLDQNRILWAGTGGWGLFGYNEGQWTRFDESRGLPDNYILGILQDGDGYLWCGCHRGIFRIQKTDTRMLFTKEPSQVDCLVWNESEGMANSECTADAQPSAWKTHDGHLLFTTVQGVADVNPSGISQQRSRIPVIIENVLADSRLLDMTHPIRLSGKVEMLEIYYTCPSLTAPEKLLFRYRLRGFDDRWTVSRPGQERTALYLNLVPGSYEFEISARMDTGLWTSPQKTFVFKIGGGNRILFLILLLPLLIGGGILVKRRSSPPPSAEKYRTSGLTPDVAKSKLNDLLRIMEEEKPYLDADLNLGRLAGNLGIHTNYLSRIINEYRNQSFNDFINQYRIHEAQTRLKDPASSALTILQIAYETGFYSKSVFNTAFKKFTGMTPSQFRRDSRPG